MVKSPWSWEHVCNQKVPKTLRDQSSEILALLGVYLLVLQTWKCCQTVLQLVPCSVLRLDGRWSAHLKPRGSKKHSGNVWNHAVVIGKTQSWAEVNRTGGNRVSDSPWLVDLAKNPPCILSLCSGFIEEMLPRSDQTYYSAAAKLPLFFFHLFVLSRLKSDCSSTSFTFQDTDWPWKMGNNGTETCKSVRCLVIWPPCRVNFIRHSRMLSLLFVSLALRLTHTHTRTHSQSSSTVHTTGMLCLHSCSRRFNSLRCLLCITLTWDTF